MVTTEHRWVKKGKRAVCVATARDERGRVGRQVEMWGDPPCREGLRSEIGKLAEKTARRLWKTTYAHQ